MDMNKRIAMPEQPPLVRAANFGEVSLGYTEEMAKAEALRCLNCKNKPCVAGCPVGVPISEFIEKIAVGDFLSAYDIIKTANALPAVCGRVCPQESQCEQKCVRGIKGEAVAIGRLERFAADYAMANNYKKEMPHIKTQGGKAAVIGSGPSGLACAGELADAGVKVTVFEALHTLGGVLVYGIPQFRLPKEIVAAEIDALEQKGVVFVKNSVAGKTFTIDELFEQGYETVFIGSGAGLPKFMGIVGEDLAGVYSANEYLTRINLMKAYKPQSATPLRHSQKVAVVGGGNVAMDAARCTLRTGAQDVYIIYRRSMEELPARVEEVKHAVEEGVKLMLLHNPTEIIGKNGEVSQIACQPMVLGEPDASGRRSPIPVEGESILVDVDTVVMAIGTNANPIIPTSQQDIAVNKWGYYVLDDNMMTSKQGVFAGGDAVTGAATVILAMGAGKEAAGHMLDFMK